MIYTLIADCVLHYCDYLISPWRTCDRLKYLVPVFTPTRGASSVPYYCSNCRLIATPRTPPPSYALQGRMLLSQSMALSRRHVVLAGIVNFIAWGYAVSWVPALRWAGYAFVVGLVLPILGLIALLLLTSRGSRYGEKYSLRRPPGPAFLAATAWKTEATALRSRQAYQRKPLYPESFIVSSAIDDLLELIVRDFVNAWYSNISKNPVFSNEVDKTIRIALTSLRDRLLVVDIAEVITARFVPIMTAHFRDFHEAEVAVRGKYLNRSVTESEELDLAIAARYKDGKLHPAASLAYADTKVLQQEYLRDLTKDLMPILLPETVLRSRAVSVIIRELVSCAVLSPVLQILSNPDTWNQAMEAYVRNSGTMFTVN